ncbi:nitroreductase family deazaflavin-dependent oxidoreductase [Actinoplanes sp. NPDC024001]|uniref:nitroreductase family deazaflavin-dependent oxidoreductase n=1 Tax=Actinoplanes sp. NPDC024001 TaxID=3154598 RepID=UPI0033E2F2BD
MSGTSVRKLTRADRIGDAVFRFLARAGVGPAHLLITRGRRTGLLRVTPVVIVEQVEGRYLVAPYGPVPWVLNARAAGRVGLRRGRCTADYEIREVSAEEAGPVLKRYVRIASATRPYFRAGVDAPVADFIAEAAAHPVFALTPLAANFSPDR